MANTHDAIALLKADHKKVEELFAQYEKATGDGRKHKIALEICEELTAHAEIERKAKLLAEIDASGLSKPKLKTMETTTI